MLVNEESSASSREVDEVAWRVAHVGVGGDREEAHRQLRRIAVAKAGLEVEEARWLVIGQRAEVHLDHGCASFRGYVERVLSYDPKAAGDRVRSPRRSRCCR